MGSSVTIEGNKDLSDEDLHINYDPISPGYFSTLGVPLLAGREFNDGDGPGKTKVAIISEAMAKKYFGERNPVGFHFAFSSAIDAKPEIKTLGVVKDVNQHPLPTPAF